MVVIGALLPWTWSRVTNCLTGLASASSGELHVDLPPKRINPFEQSHSLLIFAFHC
jgi:hypothetical protein